MDLLIIKTMNDTAKPMLDKSNIHIVKISDGMVSW